jgi:GNAT superfamily N-acetyltransferase
VRRRVGGVSAPQKLSTSHDLSQFDSGEPLLDQWLRHRALRNEGSGASRTYVVSAEERVVGYYTLAVGAVARADAPGRVRRNVPDPIPVMVLARLAVDRSFQKRGIGSGLLRDAVLRTAQASSIAGIRAIMVQAMSEDAKRFYEAAGFVASPVHPMSLMIPLSVAVARPR